MVVDTGSDSVFIGQPIANKAAIHPDQIAIWMDEDAITWCGLDQLVTSYASRFAERFKAGDGVALMLPNSIELIVAFFALVRIGAVVQVMDVNWPKQLQHEVLQSIDSAAVLTKTDISLTVPDKRSGPSLSPDLKPDRPFYVGFTSGSTGLPKGYCRSQPSWLASFALSDACFGMSSDERVLAMGSLATSLHLYAAIHALHTGHSVCLSEGFQPRQLVSWCHQHQLTTLYATPAQLHMLLSVADLAKLGPMRSVKRVMVSGAKWLVADSQLFGQYLPNADWYEFYGTSEMSFISMRSSIELSPPASVGKPLPGVCVSIRDEAGSEQSANQPGRIWVKSRLLFDGYACGATRELPRQDGWLSVRDHGWIDEQGYLFLAGREQRMLVCSGVNVYPEQIEQVVLQHAAVKYCVVLGVADRLRGQRLIAVVALNDANDDLDFESTGRQHCREYLPVSHQPWRWLVLRQWPELSSGKPDVQAIQQQVDALFPAT